MKKTIKKIKISVFLSLVEKTLVVACIGVLIAAYSFYVKAKELTLLNEEQAFQINFVFISLVVVIILLLVGLLMLVHFTRIRVLRPVDELTKRLQERETTTHPQENFPDDEIGILAGKFYEVKNYMEEAYEKLKESSLKDDLTGIYNRNYFFQIGDNLHKRQLREDNPLSLLILDVDKFKEVNDTYGHLLGDEVLRRVAHVISDTVRETDVVARYGGEEFVALLINADIENATHVAEKIREKIADEVFKSIDKDKETTVEYSILFSLTISIGGTRMRKDDENLISAISRADKALYEAKEGGRNKSVIKE